MGIDRTNAGTDNPAEATEEPPPPDRRPPPDRPGAEGVPSRADSRNGAAAANEVSAQNAGETKDDSETAPIPEASDGTASESNREMAGNTEPEGYRADRESDRLDGGNRQEGAAGNPETERAPESAPRDTSQQEQPPDNQATPQDDTKATRWDEHSSPPGSPESLEGQAASKAPNPEATDQAASTDLPGAQTDANYDSTLRHTNDTFIAAPDSPQAPHDSPDASDDVAVDYAQEPVRPADGTDGSAQAADDEAQLTPPGLEQAASAEILGEAELEKPLDAAESGTPAELTEAVQKKGSSPLPNTDSQGRDELSRAADAGAEDSVDPKATTADHPEELAKSAESKEDSDRASSAAERAPEESSTDSTDEATPTEDLNPSTEGPEHSTDPWSDIKVRDMPLEQYLDRTAGNYTNSGQRDTPDDDFPNEGPAWVEKRSDLPSGEALRDMDSDKLSRLDHIRKEGYRQLNDAIDVTHKGFDLGAEAFARPPTHAETRSVEPHPVEAPQHGVTVGEAATSLLAATVVFGELIRVGRDKLAQRKKDKNVNNR